MKPFTPPAAMPQLTALADACMNGACNVSGLCISLGECVQEVPAPERRTHPALKMIIGQLSFLLGESVGPTTEAYTQYQSWRNQ